MPLQSYKELVVWQRAIELVVALYKLTDGFPREEIYGLANQARRAVVSIPSNIAEGQRRKDIPEFLHFLRIADASSAELETQVIIAKRLYKHLDYTEVDSLLEEVQKMLNVLIRKLKTKNQKLKTCGAFTLIELLIVVAIMSVISVAGITTFLKYRNGQNLKLSAQDLVTAVRDAENRSKTQENGARWGIRLTNATSSQKFEIWSGAYATSSIVESNTLRNGIQFGNPSLGSYLNLAFSAITGQVASGTTNVVTLNDGGGDGLINDIIVNALGAVTSRYDSGLVGYWHFDENASTTAYDASGSGNNGTLQGNPAWTTGTSCKAGNCLSFNGNSYVAIPNGPALQPANLSVAYWVNFGSFTDSWEVSNNPSTFDYNHGYMVREDTPTNTVGAFIGYGTANAGIWSGTLSTGIWYFVVETYDGSTLRLYINGNQVGSGVSVNKPIDYTGVANYVYLAQRSDGGLRLQGSMDEVRIYNRALSASEIQTMYNDLK